MLNENLTPEDLAAMVAAALLDGENGPFEIEIKAERTVKAIFADVLLEVSAYRGEPVDARGYLRRFDLTGGKFAAYANAEDASGEATPESVALVVRDVLRQMGKQLRDRVAPLIAAKQAVDGVLVAESPSAEARAKGAEMASAALAYFTAE